MSFVFLPFNFIQRYSCSPWSAKFDMYFRTPQIVFSTVDTVPQHASSTTGSHCQPSHGVEATSKVHQATAATPAVSFTPTDVNIPSRLYDKIPNLDLYKKLQDAEKELDLLIAQKGLDYQSVQTETAQQLNQKGETGVLRVFIYNTCENMPWQRKSGADMSQEATWTLKVEGRFIRRRTTARLPK